MPRSPRCLLSLSYYHIMTRGNNLNKVFKQEADYHKYLELFKTYKKQHPFDLYHYCLLPNHTHFLIKTKRADDFSTFMKRLNLAYFYYYKRNYGWVGHFWQGRFKSQPVGKDEYFIQCGKYIELNPIRGGLVSNPDDYPFSSYKFYTEGNNDNLVTEDIFYQKLGKTVKERQLKYKEMIINEIVESTYHKKAWGSKEQRYNEGRKVKYHLTK